MNATPAPPIPNRWDGQRLGGRCHRRISFFRLAINEIYLRLHSEHIVFAKDSRDSRETKPKWARLGELFEVLKWFLAGKFKSKLFRVRVRVFSAAM